LTGHDHLNKPANGMGVSDKRAGAALGDFAVNDKKGSYRMFQGHIDLAGTREPSTSLCGAANNAVRVQLAKS
jgi:hypothetical protein